MNDVADLTPSFPCFPTDTAQPFTSRNHYSMSEQPLGSPPPKQVKVTVRMENTRNKRSTKQLIAEFDRDIRAASSSRKRKRAFTGICVSNSTGPVTATEFQSGGIPLSTIENDKNLQDYCVLWPVPTPDEAFDCVQPFQLNLASGECLPCQRFEGKSNTNDPFCLCDGDILITLDSRNQVMLLTTLPSHKEKKKNTDPKGELGVLRKIETNVSLFAERYKYLFKRQTFDQLEELDQYVEMNFSDWAKQKLDSLIADSLIVLGDSEFDPSDLAVTGGLDFDVDLFDPNWDWGLSQHPNTQLEESRRQLTSLTQELASSNASRDRFRQELQESRRQLTSLTQELASSRASRDRFQQELQESRRQLTSLTQELASSNASRDRFRQELQESRRQQSSLTQELASSNASRDRFRQELQESRRQQSSLTQELASSRASRDRFQQELQQKLQQQNIVGNWLFTKLQETQKQLCSLICVQGGLIESSKASSIELQNKTVRLHQTQDELNELKKKFDRLQEEKTKIREHLQRAVKEVRVHRDRAYDLQLANN